MANGARRIDCCRERHRPYLDLPENVPRGARRTPPEQTGLMCLCKV